MKAKILTGVQAADPGISINFNLPGMSVLRDIFGGIGGLMVLLCAVALFVSAGFWAAGHFADNPGRASGGKTGVVISLVAAFVIGGGSALIRWASDLGGTI